LREQRLESSAISTRRKLLRTESQRKVRIEKMFKRILKWLGAIAVYDKVFAEILFDHPEILSTLGFEQFGNHW
jgi:hypothetical protein